MIYIYLPYIYSLLAYGKQMIIDREAEESLGDEVKRKLDFLREKEDIHMNMKGLRQCEGKEF